MSSAFATWVCSQRLCFCRLSGTTEEVIKVYTSLVVKDYQYEHLILTDMSLWEIGGWAMWALSIAFEHTSDLQKKRFIRDCVSKKIKNAVCEVRYLVSRVSVFKGSLKETNFNFRLGCGGTAAIPTTLGNGWCGTPSF